MTAVASRLKPPLVLSSQLVQSSRPQEENTESNSAFAARSMISLLSATGCHSGPVAFSRRRLGDVKVTCSRFGCMSRPPDPDSADASKSFPPGKYKSCFTKQLVTKL